MSCVAFLLLHGMMYTIACADSNGGGPDADDLTALLEVLLETSLMPDLDRETDLVRLSLSCALCPVRMLRQDATSTTLRTGTG
jgi:hypothetical protein